MNTFYLIISYSGGLRDRGNASVSGLKHGEVSTLCLLADRNGGRLTAFISRETKLHSEGEVYRELAIL